MAGDDEEEREERGEYSINPAGSNEIISVKRRFLSLQEESHRAVKVLEERDYIICPELECPVCLVEMLPPTKIWQCRSGHLVCQSCRRNPNMGSRCPVCRQEIIGRATTLEKISERFFKLNTGTDVVIIEEEEEEPVVSSSRNSMNSQDPFLQMIFTPRRNDLDELLRFVTNISFLTRNTS